jgi:hypothetical protein
VIFTRLISQTTPAAIGVAQTRVTGTTPDTNTPHSTTSTSAEKNNKLHVNK